MPAVIGRRDGAVAYLQVSNPERRNALTLAMWRQIPALIRQFENEDQVRVLVLTGTGDKAFISGADISEFDKVRSTPQDVEAYEEAVSHAEHALNESKLPTIAAINGACFGGGLGLAASCDLRYAVSTATFCMPAAKLGLGYGVDNVRLFRDLLPVSALKEVFFTGKVFDAARAEHIGFVNEVFSPSGFEDGVTAVAQTIASNAPLTLQAFKQAVRALGLSGDEQLLDKARKSVQACFDSEDYREGRQAFSQKRRPVFQGR